MIEEKNSAIGEEEVSDIRPRRRSDGGKRIAKQHLPVVNVTAADLKQHFKTVQNATVEETLGDLRGTFSSVDKLIKQRDALLAENEELKAKLAEAQAVTSEK